MDYNKSIPMDCKQLILASDSPRRTELLTQAHINFKKTTHSFSEETHPHSSPTKYVRELSYNKALLADLNGLDEQSLVLGADTIVYFKGSILGKPKSADEAVSVIKELSGKTHEVYSGISLIDNANNKSYLSVTKTKVSFYELDNDFIKYYIANSLYKGFAGGYAIQGIFSLVVKKISGSYSNIVGLPMESLYKLFKKTEYNFFKYD